MNNIDNEGFLVGEIANDFRDMLTRHLSSLYSTNGWSSKFKVYTNADQDAFRFKQSLENYSSGIAIAIKNDIDCWLAEIKLYGWSFDAKWVSIGEELEITNLSYK
ncbi:hypothetical protein [Aquamicrobium sp.]|uniref:hypothetical protein n=1 Tax=Aquamicrobium sp. TaxID=1872579 RepID=UPI00258EFA26|nr:hypothetical protein [Aquamicrobium sp.]MCK9551160.1 hypothetical protein [Aquamicrobium sp.]